MTTSKKTPQDRKPKASVEKQERPEDVKGFNLLRSIDEVPVWDQAPLLALVSRMTDKADEEKGTIEMGNEDAILLIGQIAKTMVPFAVDEAAFTKFCTGRTALQDVMTLAIAWTSVLGEDKSSDGS